MIFREGEDSGGKKCPSQVSEFSRDFSTKNVFDFLSKMSIF